MKNGIETYKNKRMRASLPYINVRESMRTGIAVVIPALNEYPGIFSALESLAASFAKSAESLPPCMVVVVVNNRPGHSDEIKQNNRLLLRKLNETAEKSGFGSLCVTAIDCSSEGRELPESDGVGLARKIGMDYALCRGALLLACFDADTLADIDYFPALGEYFARCGLDGSENANGGSAVIRAAVTGFSHRKAEDARRQAAIDSYESYLKTHSALLASGGFPFYPVALGPTIVCTAAAYAAAGGMSRKNAGEDFYFLQSLIKVCPGFLVDSIPTEVHPSARFSDRVPFGTGVAIEELFMGVSFGFSNQCYEVLKKWIGCARLNCAAAAASGCDRCAELMEGAGKISSALADFCERENFPVIWKKLFQNSRKSAEHLETAFFYWFDALKCIRLFHHLTEHSGD